MTILEAIQNRHSVRAYKNEPISADVREKLDAEVCRINEEGNLHISIHYDDPDGFGSKLAHYGSFRNVNNYIVLAGTGDDDFDLRCGYYGERLVIYAQQLGLNTCWAALTYNKKKVKELLLPGETLCMVIALGYGETQGNPHKGKSFSDVTAKGEYPQWFIDGVEAALLAPTAVNQQKFMFSMDRDKAVLKIKGLGTCLKTDLGIIKYHFEVVSGHEVLV